MPTILLWDEKRNPRNKGIINKYVKINGKSGGLNQNKIGGDIGKRDHFATNTVGYN